MSELVVHGETESTDLYVVFKVAEGEYALSTETVVQMESFQGATRVPGAPPFVLGLIQIRGRVHPVVDLRARFGLEPAAHSIARRVVVGRHAERVVALLVDSSREVVTIAKGALAPPPKLLEDAAGGFVSAVAQVGPRMILVLDFAKVIGEESLDVV